MSRPPASSPALRWGQQFTRRPSPPNVGPCAFLHSYPCDACHPSGLANACSSPGLEARDQVWIWLPQPQGKCHKSKVCGLCVCVIPRHLDT